jgi:hypothetical protein
MSAMHLSSYIMNREGAQSIGSNVYFPEQALTKTLTAYSTGVA